jgi:hypothetical protein
MSFCHVSTQKSEANNVKKKNLTLCTQVLSIETVVAASKDSQTRADGSYLTVPLGKIMITFDINTQHNEFHHNDTRH